ncbi:hypothetical protein [Adlercreutzia muris]|uniref:hypothetical protein n=1 Tax=Adlercreutzia muris TaxID=1796610 RepID=UPI003514CFF3
MSGKGNQCGSGTDMAYCHYDKEVKPCRLCWPCAECDPCASCVYDVCPFSPSRRVEEDGR